MGLFSFVSGWDRPIHDAIDVKMTEMTKVGVAVAREKIPRCLRIPDRLLVREVQQVNQDKQ